jgi:tetratricopeptide (TPR) repeat protein
VHNTLGTIFQALGRRALARSEYERALQLDPATAYALNNLCYGWVLEGRVARAVAACEHAIRIEPGLTAARNNLGLAHAVAGDGAAASVSFGQTGDRATERYNTGIVRLAARDFKGAVAAFESAHAARPSLAAAAARAEQARIARAEIEER